jgi:hypothetical protein
MMPLLVTNIMRVTAIMADWLHISHKAYISRRPRIPLP